jgi:hypothetical protein
MDEARARRVGRERTGGRAKGIGNARIRSSIGVWAESVPSADRAVEDGGRWEKEQCQLNIRAANTRRLEDEAETLPG